ncbi:MULTISPECIES: DUF1441 family protein [unclassified Paraburkholderia]|uniref:DUF1441 family protein n=1 Tax=unclassified Paraburkholderia TaxID=2615204 RepID=UPI00288A1C6C|nr:MULTISPECIES: DUF1441 family protein [unclassified Paraburkholderia]
MGFATSRESCFDECIDVISGRRFKATAAEPDFEVTAHWLTQFGPIATVEQIARLAAEGVTVKASHGHYFAGLSLRHLWRRTLDQQAEARFDDDPLRQAQIDSLCSRTRINDLELSKLEGELMPVAQHAEQMADLAKYFATFLDTLPDVLERSAGLTPEQVSELVRKVTSVRADLYRNALAIVTPDKQPAAGENGDRTDVAARRPVKR